MMNQAEMMARHGLKEWMNETNKVMKELSYSIQKISAGELVEDEQIVAYIESLQNEKGSWNSVGQEHLFNSKTEELPYYAFDAYIRGIVRWMNELGMMTMMCCDGHGERHAYVEMDGFLNDRQMHVLNLAIPSDSAVRIRFRKNRRRHTVLFDYSQTERKALLDIAEMLFKMSNDERYIQMLETERFKHRLLDWLEVPGESGREQKVRRRLTSSLRKLTDEQQIDEAGNLLATVRHGEGPTILLSAHMDTVERIKRGRVIHQEGTILTSSEGILGADDRAGIASVLEILERLPMTHFTGTIKVAFTVEEEIGLCGARGINQEFIRDVDAAIVLDRRGTRDIVTGCRGMFDFCEKSYGELFERAGRLVGMDDWKATRNGGSSDAKIFAEFGIPSVNLSIGYRDEHTDFEEVDYCATFETVVLVETVLSHRLIQQNS
ncbi:M20/M25/M40 family metallo-hydrolase [Exiguobacterium chiriqhucha]|nr:M20/M25/M40 family metallo-hydrolase [Exiguobacterium chiriqhucha]